MADNFRHSAFRLTSRLPIGSQLYHHLVAADGSFGLFVRNKDVMGKPLVVWQDKPIILLLLFLEQSYYCRHSSGYDPHNPAFPAASLPLGVFCNHKFHLITVKGAVSILHHHKTEAFQTCSKSACQMLCLALAVFPPLGQINPAVCLKGFQYFS